MQKQWPGRVEILVSCSHHNLTELLFVLFVSFLKNKKCSWPTPNPHFSNLGYLMNIPWKWPVSITTKLAYIHLTINVRKELKADTQDTMTKRRSSLLTMYVTLGCEHV